VSAPSGANIGIAFSGWNDPDKASGESDPIFDSLVGDKWIDAGGGDETGRWNADWIQAWESSIKSGKLGKWRGIVFDIEECYNEGLAQNFASLFAAAKVAGFQVLVTVSNSAPYGCSDAEALMTSFFENRDVDYLSPQLYESGDETSPIFDAGAVGWSKWAAAQGRVVPSIGCKALRNGGYEQTKSFLGQHGVSATGYIMWPSSGCSLSEVSGSQVLV
jgi:hypothetical protein